MSLTAEQLYELLPAIYRIRDFEQGEPLKALVAEIAGQAAVMEADIRGLYENWFIETCEEWVVPYIGDLLGVRGLHALAGAPFSQRALVAHTMGYRKRKGTPPMLEQLARDTTGWNARAVEFFELLETTQHYNHIRLHNHRTPDLRRTNELELIDTAFDQAAHTADVRHIASGRGRHNIPNIGLFIWRLQSYFVSRAAANAAAPGGRYRFNPLGEDLRLFNRPQTEVGIVHLAEEINVPGLLRRRPLYDELEAKRQSPGYEPATEYFGSQPVLEVFVRMLPGEAFRPVPPEEILICNLIEPPGAGPGEWLQPSASKLYQPPGGVAPESRPISVAVDPVLGRLAFPATAEPDAVEVSYAYGFSGDVGGGPYNRRQSVNAALTREINWHAAVSKGITPAGNVFSTLTAAVAAWNQFASASVAAVPPISPVGVIAIMDSQTYQEDLILNNKIRIPEGGQLTILAAGLPIPLPDEGKLKLAEIATDHRRPHLRGELVVLGTAPADSLTPGELVLDGLLLQGRLRVRPGNLGSVRINHCTLVPGKRTLLVRARNEHLEIALNRSICGAIDLADSVAGLHLNESIVDGSTGGPAIAAPGTAVQIEKTTVFGSTTALWIEAGNSIFTGALDVARRQVGCARFSYLPYGSKTPRRYRCQPDLALTGVVVPAEQDAVRTRMEPSFTSDRYGHHAYAQLSDTCAVELRTGAEDGSEMGVFSFLMQPQRTTNLQTGLDEYLRFGLEAGIIYVT